jgi:hypothetical protein
MLAKALPLSLLLFVGAPVALAQDCPSASNSADLTARIDATQTALSELNVEGFQVSNQELFLLLPCLDEALSPQIAAQVHLLEGVRLFVNGETGSSAQAFLAARAISPESQLATSIFPEGHEIHGNLSSLGAEGISTEKVATPQEGQILFDGQASGLRPTSHPTLVQLLDAGSVVTHTRYTLPGEALPAYRGTRKLRKTMFLTSAVSALGGLALYGLAWSNRSAFDAYDPAEGGYDANASLAELEAFQQRSYLLTGGSLALFGVSAGAVVTGLRAGER